MRAPGSVARLFIIGSWSGEKKSAKVESNLRSAQIDCRGLIHTAYGHRVCFPNSNRQKSQGSLAVKSHAPVDKGGFSSRS